ncbi:hypothetical protein AGMMS49944_31610 [Spirochaetia bacterium]|nr:hypothetical protein AGMMS49944_31610 [Spirochaetia bacterium]
MFSPKVSVGMSWGGYGTEDTNAEDPDAEDGASTEDGVPSFNNTKLGIKLEAAYGRFAADYQLSIGLDEKPYSGIDNLLNLYWTAQLSVMEKLTLKARPQLQFDIFGGERMFYFGFAPILEAALHYQITPKIGVVTGVRFDILRVETKKREKGDAWTDDTGSSWQVTPAGAVGGNVAFELSPSEHFTLELGIGGFFDFNESEYKVDFTTITGCLACIFRL